LTLTSESRQVTIGTHYSKDYEMEEITIAHTREHAHDSYSSSTDEGGKHLGANRELRHVNLLYAYSTA
jgi:hypothetical protein